MAYKVTIEKDLDKKIKQIRNVNFKEYTLFANKVEEIKNYASIRKNHKTRFNTFDRPLKQFKWVEVNNKILVFTLNPIKSELHICDYLPKEEVFK